jgi:hypothetical protein
MTRRHSCFFFLRVQLDMALWEDSLSYLTTPLLAEVFARIFTRIDKQVTERPLTSQ